MGIVNFGLKYGRGIKLSLLGYCDTDYGGDLENKKSASNVFFFLGGNIMTWMVT